MTFESFQQLQMVHLCSGIDDDRPIASGAGAHASTITGYTEWLSRTEPAITIGWDWEVIGVRGKARLIQTGTPGRNLMFVDQNDRDLGTAQTTAMLVDWLNTFHWQTDALIAVCI